MRSTTPADATRRVRRAANSGAIACLAFITLFVVSAEVGSIRDHSPWAEDPWDAFVSVAALLIAFGGPLTFVRVQIWRGRAVMPVAALRPVLHGVAVVTLASTAATIAAGHALLTGERRGEWDGSLGLLVALLITTAALTAMAIVVLVRVGPVGTTLSPGDPLTASSESSDAVNDLLVFGGMVAGQLPSTAFQSRLVAASHAGQRFLSTSTWSPRRWRTRFVVVVAVLFGASSSLWHLLVEGVPATAADAVASYVVFGAVASAIVLASYLALGEYLGLIRAA